MSPRHPAWGLYSGMPMRPPVSGRTGRETKPGRFSPRVQPLSGAALAAAAGTRPPSPERLLSPTAPAAAASSATAHRRRPPRRPAGHGNRALPTQGPGGGGGPAASRWAEDESRPPRTPLREGDTRHVLRSKHADGPTPGVSPGLEGLHGRQGGRVGTRRRARIGRSDKGSVSAARARGGAGGPRRLGRRGRGTRRAPGPRRRGGARGGRACTAPPAGAAPAP